MFTYLWTLGPPGSRYLLLLRVISLLVQHLDPLITNTSGIGKGTLLLVVVVVVVLITYRSHLNLMQRVSLVQLVLLTRRPGF